MFIVIKEKDRVIVMSSVTDNIKRMANADMVCEDNRVIRVNGDVIYCFSVAGRSADIFLYDDRFYEFEVSPESIVNDMIPYMYQKVRHEKDLDDKQWDNPCWDNALTIIKDNRIFDITPSFYFKEENDFLVHGWNIEPVIGSLETTRGEDAETRIRKAVGLYRKVYYDTVYPCVVVDSKEMKLQIWEE